jgi:dihydroorotate dehydrogenase
VVNAYSRGRIPFLDAFYNARPKAVVPPASMEVKAWNLTFRSPIMNSAGMFKNGEGYEAMYRQGAGAYLAGTTTTYPRQGNEKDGLRGAFAPYPRSGSASNWLGLPNKGHEAVAKNIADLPRYEKFPIGISVMTAPESHGLKAVEELIEGMKLYEQAKVDFIEMNESCPNAGHDHSMDDLQDRLTEVSRKFLEQRSYTLPVIVKFSNDTDIAQLPSLLDMLRTLGFDGVNFGNTSTQYAKHRETIHPSEQALFDHFAQQYGGGVSGRPLAQSSMELATKAVQYCTETSERFSKEFHVLRTGGIESFSDVRKSQEAGVSLCQWYTGYFEAFAHHGHRLYKHFYGMES